MKQSHFLWIITLILFFSCKPPVPKELRVMSFNVWLAGGKSVGETARVIVDSKADIVGLQESIHNGFNFAAHVADSLGWYCYSPGESPSIISRYAIVDTSALSHGVKIQINKKHFVWMVNVHLMYRPYQPYQINGIEYCGGALLSTPEEVVAAALEARGGEIQEIIQDLKEIQKDGCPVFLTGDFNEPSCMDWTSRAVDAGLCKAIVAWPSTKALMEQAGLQDSYRTLYPDEVAKPGHTWSPIPETQAYKDVLDRIDFVFYWGNTNPVNSQLAGENSNLSDIRFDHYPSDHRSVVTTFVFN